MNKLLTLLLLTAGLNLMLDVVVAVPIWLLWTIGGLGARYFGFLPTAWQSLPLSHLIGAFKGVKINASL